jgi:hypothetical protein
MKNSKRKFTRLNPDGIVFPPKYNELCKSCKDCKNDFLISVGEQEKSFYESNCKLPLICKDCCLRRYVDKRYNGNWSTYEIEEGNGAFVCSGNGNIVGFVYNGSITGC